MSNWIVIGKIEEIPRRGARTVETKDGPIAVFRTGEDQIFALADRCPHRGGPLSDGIVSGKLVACPLHDWVIDLETGEAIKPDTGCAPTLAVKVLDGVIWLKLEPGRKAAHG
jgi:nitrite reductase (NADH) small subunit